MKIATDPVDLASQPLVACTPPSPMTTSKRLRELMAVVAREDASVLYMAVQVLEVVAAVTGDREDWRDQLLGMMNGPRQAHVVRKPRAWTADELDALRALRQQGMTQGEAAEVLGRTRKSVERAEARAGGAFRTQARAA